MVNVTGKTSVDIAIQWNREYFITEEILRIDSSLKEEDLGSLEELQRATGGDEKM